jgi:hypothetical protein
MIFTQGQGQAHYHTCLTAAEESKSIGVHLHMRQQTLPTSRLGFAGKKVSKKAKKELAEKLLAQALKTKNPELVKAAGNMLRYLHLK